jgi:LPXTG-motif cell wall-anchored protein
VLIPAIACALCPACLAVWAPLLATLGIGVVLSEGQHRTLLVLAVALSIGLAAIRVHRGGPWAPFSMTATGGAILLVSHWLQESGWLSLLGVLFLVGGSLFARRSNRRVRAVFERLET